MHGARRQQPLGEEGSGSPEDKASCHWTNVCPVCLALRWVYRCPYAQILSSLWRLDYYSHLSDDDTET